MGDRFRHTCPLCGFTTSTDGPWGLLRDDGRYELAGNLYCTDCMIGFTAIIAESTEPSGEAAHGRAVAPPTPPGFRGHCPCCGSEEVLFLDRTPGRHCPVCGEGTMDSTREAST